MKEFAESYRPLRQRTVREETTKGKTRALPLGVYTKQQDSTKVDLLADKGTILTLEISQWGSAATEESFKLLRKVGM